MKPVPATLAFAVACSAVGTYAAMDVFMKALSIQSGAYGAVLWRSVAGVAISGAIFLARRGRWPARAALRLHLLRGATAGISVLFFFWGLARIPMAKGVALTFLAPLIALFLAAGMLGERLRRAAVWGSLVASAGVLVIALGEIETGASTDSVLGALAVFVASIFYAVSLIFLRRQAQAADPIEVTLFTGLVMGGMLLPAAPWLAGLPEATQMPSVIAAAVLGTVSSIGFAWAYSHAEAQVLAPVEYTAFAWAALFGWAAFGEVVTAFTVGGTALIVLGCLMAVRRAAGPAPQSEAGA
ncbi:MAG TPA: DMT family transporter [Sphingomonas sp.]|jgi:S-adenosylmethionine uptake transporter|uniref:DMT family transporter n=1 Tax=Sphingomonas sp. TaxID=28214 RepID=UPI002ED834F7